MRQPNVIICAGVSTRSKAKNKPLHRKNPIGAPTSGNAPYNARLLAGAFSVATNTAPDHSPPSPIPWTNRQRQSNNAPQTPIT